jgi:hypothetical protein
MGYVLRNTDDVKPDVTPKFGVPSEEKITFFGHNPVSRRA